MNLLRILQTVLAIILIAGCCDQYISNLKDEKLLHSITRAERDSLRKENDTLNFITQNLRNKIDEKLDVLNGQYLRCFVFMNKPSIGPGFLRPIIEHEEYQEYLPLVLFDSIVPGLAVDSVIYIKLKLVNEIPFGYDFKDSNSVPLIYDLKRSSRINKLKDIIKLNFHNIGEILDHVDRGVHVDGHIWSRIPIPGSEFQKIVIGLDSAVYDIPPDTFFISNILSNKIPLTEKPLFFEHAKDSIIVGNDTLLQLIGVDTMHRHLGYPKSFHYKK